MKIAIFKKPRIGYDTDGYSYTADEAVIENVQSIEIDRDEYYTLKRYYKNTEWDIVEIHPNPKEFVELHLEKALKLQKEQERKLKIAQEESKRLSDLKKKAREEKKKAKLIQEARRLLESEGVL
jgi:predicted RNA-binding protein with PUA-like domain